MAATPSGRRPRSRILRVLGYTFALLAILIVVAVGLLVLYPERAVQYAAATISKSTGRELKIEGPIQARILSWKPRLVLEKVTFANADWSKQKEMLDAGRFEIVLAARRLLHGELVFKRLVLANTDLRLEQRRDGTNNWTLAATEVAEPDDRSDVPAIRHVHVKNSRLFYVREGAAESDTSLQLDTATGTIARNVELKADGRYQKHPARFTIKAGSIAELQDEDHPYPLDASVTAGPTSASMKGHLTGGLDSGGLDVKMTIKGDTLSGLYPLIGVVLPKSPPYQLTGKLGHEGSVWSFTGFDGRMGDSDLGGDLKVDTGPKRPFMKANLKSKLLDFDDLAGLIGAPPSTGAGESATAEQKAEAAKLAASGRLLPDEPIDVPRLQAMDIDARLLATRVNAPNHMPIDKLDLHVTLKDGTLKAEPALFHVGNGSVELYTTLHSVRKPARVDLDLKARNVEAARILGDTPFTKETGGKIGGGAKLVMSGNSLRAMLATADGNIQFAMADARISHLLVEMMGLDIMQSIGIMIKGDAPIPVRCAAFDLAAQKGKLRSNLAVLDTDDTNVTFDLSLDLSTEKLSMRVVPHPKDTSLLALRQDLRVEGRLADLDYYPDPLKLGRVKGFMQKVNYLLAPVVGLLTPFDIGDKEDQSDNGCAAFLRDAQAPASVKTGRNKGLIPPTKVPAIKAPVTKASATRASPTRTAKLPPARLPAGKQTARATKTR